MAGRRKRRIGQQQEQDQQHVTTAERRQGGDKKAVALAAVAEGAHATLVAVGRAHAASIGRHGDCSVAAAGAKPASWKKRCPLSRAARYWASCRAASGCFELAATPTTT